MMLLPLLLLVVVIFVHGDGINEKKSARVEKYANILHLAVIERVVECGFAEILIVEVNSYSYVAHRKRPRN